MALKNDFFYFRHGGKKLSYETGSFDRNTGETKSVLVENVQFYPGPMDIALVRIIDLNDTLSSKRVFPCILNSEGSSQTMRQKLTGILEAKISAKSPKSTRVKFRGIPLRMEETSLCTERHINLCGTFPAKRDLNVTVLDIKSAPLFVKVGRTRWSLAGLGVTANDNAVRFEPVFQALDWMDDVILNHRLPTPQYLGRGAW